MEDELLSAPAFTDAPDEGESAHLTKLGRELAQTDREIQELELQLKVKNQRKLELTQRELPEYLQKIGQDKLGLPEFNVDLVMENYYHANIKAEWDEDKRKAGFDHLDEIGGGSLIKTQVVFLFGRNEIVKVKWLLAFIKIVQHYLTEEGLSPHAIPEPTIGMAVPWNTLTAFVKEQVEAGTKLDLEKLGATVGKVVKIKQRKA